MASLKDIQRKIAAVKKTQQITRAMNMVAASKLRGAQTRMENFRPYAGKFAEVMGSLAGRIEGDIHPFLVQPEEVKKIELLAFSSDRGLCGSFNMNVIDAVSKFEARKRSEGVEVTLTLVGRKLRDFFRRRNVNLRKAYTDVMTSFDYAISAAISREAMDIFLQGEVDEVWAYYTHFEGMGRQKPQLMRVLPIAPAENKEGDLSGMEYLCEPSLESMMIDLLPKSVEIQIYNFMLETSTSEHSARMAAMDNATKNCKEMITDLTLAFNKARQAAITTELMDIVGGAEALRS
ncbi:MAG: ATP synthase F1 subunit gamma [Proteobacteria bacterium]|nr:ATP synthase F1 subunit gamma [Pseudomonadota bacterium]